MSFLSGLKKVGKIALKVAPYAALAIPGLGIPASMAIQAGLGAANAKVGGAGWKGVLAGAGIGAGTGAISGGAGNIAKGATKGLAPSASVATKAVNKGLGSKILDFGVKTASNAGLGGTKTEIGKGLLAKAVTMAQNRGVPTTNSGIPTDTGASPAGIMPRLGAMPAPSDQYAGGFGANFGEDQNNPNLANSINQGKLDAQRSRRIPLQHQFGYAR